MSGEKDEIGEEEGEQRPADEAREDAVNRAEKAARLLEDWLNEHDDEPDLGRGLPLLRMR